MVHRVLRMLLLVGAAVALVAAAAALRDKRTLALDTVDEIEAELGALDPATRAAVIARLTADEAKRIKSGADRIKGP